MSLNPLEVGVGVLPVSESLEAIEAPNVVILDRVIFDAVGPQRELRISITGRYGVRAENGTVTPSTIVPPIQVQFRPADLSDEARADILGLMSIAAANLEARLKARHAQLHGTTTPILAPTPENP